MISWVEDASSLIDGDQRSKAYPTTTREHVEDEYNVTATFSRRKEKEGNGDGNKNRAKSEIEAEELEVGFEPSSTRN